METNKICRICFEEDNLINLISPCNCKGSIKYIHTKCLADCIKNMNSTKCKVCNTFYNTKKNYTSNDYENDVFKIDSFIVSLLFSIILTFFLFDNFKYIFIINSIFSIIPIILLLNNYLFEYELEKKQYFKEKLIKYISVNIGNILISYGILFFSLIINIIGVSLINFFYGEQFFLLETLDYIQITLNTCIIMYNSIYYYINLNI